MRRALRADRDVAARQLGLVEGGLLGIERHVRTAPSVIP
jgi:hypothetical protein